MDLEPNLLLRSVAVHRINGVFHACLSEVWEVPKVRKGNANAGEVSWQQEVRFSLECDQIPQPSEWWDFGSCPLAMVTCRACQQRLHPSDWDGDTYIRFGRPKEPNAT